MSELKTYSGELKDGMPFKGARHSHDEYGMYEWSGEYTTVPSQVHHDNEWQLYKPQPKKVWGIPEVGQSWYAVCQDRILGWTVVEMPWRDGMTHPVLLSKEHAEQQAKAENMRDEFRLLSDVPVDGKLQHLLSFDGKILGYCNLQRKIEHAMFGVVVNDGREGELESWRENIRIANKIIQFGFHGGVVEERL